MEQDDEDPPPFWLRQLDQHQHRHQRRVSSMFLNTGVLVIILMVTAVIFLAIVIPSVVSLSRQLFNPGLVKRSWSSLNVLLVIFAIVCGFLSRKDDDTTPVNSPTKKDEYPEKMQYSNNFGDFESVLRLRRNSSSYPDLRQESNWPISDNKWRFNDDTHVDNHQFPRFDRQVISNNQLEGTKDIQVAYESRTTPPSQPLSTSYLWPSPPPPPPPQPPPSPPRRGHSSIPSKKKTIQTFETIGHGRYKWKNSGVRQPKPKKVAPPPPPPPPPPSSRQRSRPVMMDNYTENKDFFSSFYYQSKKGKHKRRSYENLENLVEPPKATSSIYRSKSTPEFPPPPPSPHSVFNQLFSKKSKPQKKVKPTKVNPPTSKKSPNKILSFTTMDDDNKFGGGDESPMRPIPPPPPPPPFKMKPLRFVTQGDYVKIESNSNKSSPIPCHNYSTSDEDESSKKSVSLFSPSPDVNIKAEDFIAKFRAKLNLEKSNSINLRQGIVPSRLRT